MSPPQTRRCPTQNPGHLGRPRRAVVVAMVTAVAADDAGRRRGVGNVRLDVPPRARLTRVAAAAYPELPGDSLRVPGRVLAHRHALHPRFESLFAAKHSFDNEMFRTVLPPLHDAVEHPAASIVRSDCVSVQSIGGIAFAARVAPPFRLRDLTTPSLARGEAAAARPLVPLRGSMLVRQWVTVQLSQSLAALLGPSATHLSCEADFISRAKAKLLQNFWATPDATALRTASFLLHVRSDRLAENR